MKTRKSGRNCDICLATFICNGRGQQNPNKRLNTARRNTNFEMTNPMFREELPDRSANSSLYFSR